jgi:hypothetical protein
MVGCLSQLVRKAGMETLPQCFGQVGEERF